MVHLQQMTHPIALKDWAVTIEALGRGTQILLMRKGGIHEETRHFEVKGDRFFLYPAYEHQKEELLKPAFQKHIAETLADGSFSNTTTQIKYFAELYEDLEVMEEEILQQLDSQHIWAPHFAVERLKWKKKLPLHVLLIRVYRLEQPIELIIQPDYVSCKSWLQLPQISNDLRTEPVLTDDEFMEKVSKIKTLLDSTTSMSPKSR